MSFVIAQAEIAQMAAKQPRNSKLSMTAPRKTLRMRPVRACALTALANGAAVQMVSTGPVKTGGSAHA